mgnify:CR=1 FL=1
MEKKLLSKDGINLVLQKFRPIDGYVQMELKTNKTSTKKIKKLDRTPISSKRVEKSCENAFQRNPHRKLHLQNKLG